MIYIHANTDEFEYDIRSMVKAFYPEYEQYVYCDESKVQPQKKPEEGPEMVLEILLLDDGMMAFCRGEEGKAQHVFTEGKERTKRKNALKKALYRLLAERTGRELPWGTLTGIRPTKLFVKALEEGKAEEEILQDMQKDYLLTGQKSELGLSIAKKERKLFSDLPMENGASLYIHIPFCPTTCLYCSFTSYPAAMWKDRMGDYIKALKKELLVVRDGMGSRELTTIYVGGGTPTTLTAEQLSELLGFVKDNFPMENLREFTVEAGRPDSITMPKLMALKENGVNRISINPQTMNEDTLQILGRQHSVEQTKEAYTLARQAGFKNINMDIILGLPNEGQDKVKYTLSEIKGLSPDNLTVHCLALKHNSRLNLEKNRYAHLTYEDVTGPLKLAADFATDMGMEPYYLYRQKQIAGNQENVGYALPGKEGLYNMLIMEEKQSIFSVGAGAITKLVKQPGELFKRVENVKDVTTYLDRIDDMLLRKKEAFEALNQ